MSGHLVVSDVAAARTVLAAAQESMRTNFALKHVTIQIEDAVLQNTEAKLPF